ncbi:MAG: CDP-alcohol phosphatidyltransferase family protein [Pseudomonadota bacterium]
MHHLPNVITIFRILLVIPIVLLMWRESYGLALLLTVIAGVSDAIDGALARRYDWSSDVGVALDPIADKLLVSALMIVFMLQGHVPLWVGIIVLARDAIILLGAALYRALFEKTNFRPTFLSKANTAIAIATLSLVLLHLLRVSPLSDWALLVLDPHLFYVLAVLGVASGADYVVTWGARAWRHGRQ